MAFTDYIKFSGFKADLQSRNFSIYGQWLGIFMVFLSIALGIVNLFHANAVIVFGILSIVQGVILAFVEIPFLMKIFRVPDSFISLVQKLDTNFKRTLFYAVYAIIQWLSLLCMATSLIAVAVLFTIDMIFYALAAVFKQDFHKSNVVASVDVTDMPVDAQIREAL
ncbi:DEKNAAC101897 [Brettanomyces naardenensis]|uniref:Golgi apparatus membrane protein TVP18 n=1 Tax=Brettanomyces naardenensis TaxID=13370 RepID=A0A448YJ38_BRENA|nr:DEKNAAC101897 [Brettanomyces naardenensis]